MGAIRYIKPQTVKDLERQNDEAKRLKFPNFPYPVASSFRDDTANGLTQCIVRFIELKGYQAERISNTGRHIRNGSTYQWVYGTGTKGTADISATIKGRSCKIEVKIGRDRQSEAQKDYQNKIESSGGIYFIAKDFTSFLEWFNKTFEA